MPENTLAGLSAQQFRKAAAVREKIDDLEKQLVSILGAGAAPARAKPGRKPKSKLSAAARAKISAAQKKRWAKRKKAAKE